MNVSEITDKSSEGSGCNEPYENETNGPSSISGASEIKTQKDFFIHKVSKFDTLAGLAIRYGISVYDIKKANGLVSDNAMYAKECLVIPLSSTSDAWKPRTDLVPETMRASSSKHSRSNRVRSASSSIALMPTEDFSERSVSEIEMEMVEEENRTQPRRENLFPSRRNYFEDARGSENAPLMRREKTGGQNKLPSFSEYLTSVATSFIKTAEELFATPSSPKAYPTTESLFDKFKKATNSASYWSYDGKGSKTRTEGMGSRKPSEGSLSIHSHKDGSKLD